MRTHILGFFSLFLLSTSFANTIIVDKNGAGQYTKIQDAIYAANTNDTIVIWPGDYVEQITLNKEIVVMGSGYESTIIRGNYLSTIIMSAGKLLWVQVSSTGSVGIEMSGGLVSNCIITGCPYSGIRAISGVSAVMNCILMNNGQHGVSGTGGTTINVSNCIGLGSANYAFNGWGTTLNLSYSNGSFYDTGGNQGCINLDPLFYSATNYHISQGSPSWDTGNPALNDPDGTRSDMGYFGGPDCPIYPVVYEIFIQPNGGLINLQAKGRANY